MLHFGHGRHRVVVNVGSQQRPGVAEESRIGLLVVEVPRKLGPRDGMPFPLHVLSKTIDDPLVGVPDLVLDSHLQRQASPVKKPAFRGTSPWRPGFALPASHPG
jgi:hypothetical protein